jgi:two-component system OmpR family sensor kinase
LKRYEKEALAKTFGIFFTAMGILVTIIAYLYLKEQKVNLNQNIFAQIKQYNFDFENKNITMDIVKKTKQQKSYELYIKPNEIYALFPISKNKNKFLKIIYPIELYNKQLDKIQNKTLLIYIGLLLFLFLFSLLYSFYALHPMKKAIKLMDEFFKDIVHDLNTPISAILLNTQYLAKINPSQEVDKISISAKRISSLYKNFELINNKFNQNYSEDIDIYELLQDRIDYHKQIFTNINFTLQGDKFFINLPKESLIRIFDNIISNAAKYNKPKGDVKITIIDHKILFEDTGIGINNPDKIFERYYKETSRGIGIGMNIVKKLCDKLDIQIKVDSKINLGTTILLDFNHLTLK